MVISNGNWLPFFTQLSAWILLILTAVGAFKSVIFDYLSKHKG